MLLRYNWSSGPLGTTGLKVRSLTCNENADAHTHANLWHTSCALLFVRSGWVGGLSGDGGAAVVLVGCGLWIGGMQSCSLLHHLPHNNP